MNFQEEIVEKWEELFKRISKKSLMRIEEIAQKYIVSHGTELNHQNAVESKPDDLLKQHNKKIKEANRSMLKSKRRKGIVFKKEIKLKEQMQNEAVEQIHDPEDIVDNHPFENVFIYKKDGDSGKSFLGFEDECGVEELVDLICDDERETVLITFDDENENAKEEEMTSGKNMKTLFETRNTSKEAEKQQITDKEAVKVQNTKLNDALSKLKAKLKSKPKESLKPEPIAERNLYKAAVLNQLCKSPFKKPHPKFNSNFYKPKIQIPSIDSDDELSMEFSYEAPGWAKNPRLVELITLQDHEELDDHFRNPVPINVYAMFPDVKNVTNDSPNKWNNTEKKS